MPLSSKLQTKASSDNGINYRGPQGFKSQSGTEAVAFFTHYLTNAVICHRTAVI